MKHLWTITAVLVGIATQMMGSYSLLVAQDDLINLVDIIDIIDPVSSSPHSAADKKISDAPKPKQLESGSWKFTEKFVRKSKQSVWRFEFIDDGSKTIVALGTRTETDGVSFQYGGGEAIVVFDRQEDGSLTGIYFEADNSGNQVEYNLDIVVLNEGKKIYMAAVDETMQLKSNFVGEWLGIEERVPLKKGKWSLREIVGPDNGKYNIKWHYKLNEAKGKIYGGGHKSTVNGRRAHSLEQKTVCNIFLQRQGGESSDLVEGTGTEKSPSGKTFYAAYEGWVSPSGEKFVLLSYENNTLAAVIVGEHNN